MIEASSLIQSARLGSCVNLSPATIDLTRHILQFFDNL